MNPVSKIVLRNKKADRVLYVRQDVSPVELIKFFANVEENLETGCWVWVGPRNYSGYGRFTTDGWTQQAHRWIYEAFHGKLDSNKIHVHHECHNTSCVNPLHLAAVTVREHSFLSRRQRALVDYMDETMCIRGHKLEGDNLYNPPGTNKRRCRQCLADWSRARNEEIRKAIEPFLEMRQTHCRNGHLLTEENVYLFRGKKLCRECHNRNSANYYATILKASNEERLRTDTFPANSKFKTTCKRGHDMTDPDNLRRTVTGRRCCRQCAIEAQRRRWNADRENKNRQQNERYAAKKRAKADLKAKAAGGGSSGDDGESK